MRTLHSFFTVCVLGASLVALISACGSTDNGTGGSAGAATAGAGASHSAGAAGTAAAGAAGAAPMLTGDATRGQALYSKMEIGCNGCHAPNGEGKEGPNITNSSTAGIGMWTYQEFHDAVRSQKKRGGGMLGQAMVPFTEMDVNEQGLADIYSWLKTKSSDVVVRGSFKGTAICM